jgi:hypothetical protein
MIRTHVLMALALGLAFAAPVLALVQAKQEPAKPEHEKQEKPEAKGKPETELHKSMEALDDGLHKLKVSMKDPTKSADSLAALAGMERSAQECKLQTPKMTSTVPEADRAEFVKSFRKQIIVLQQRMLEMETALLDGDHAKAEELLRKLKLLEEDGHEKFTNE